MRSMHTSDFTLLGVWGAGAGRIVHDGEDQALDGPWGICEVFHIEK